MYKLCCYPNFLSLSPIEIARDPFHTEFCCWYVLPVFFLVNHQISLTVISWMSKPLLSSYLALDAVLIFLGYTFVWRLCHLVSFWGFILKDHSFMDIIECTYFYVFSFWEIVGLLLILFEQTIWDYLDYRLILPFLLQWYSLTPFLLYFN